jgi:superfamily I DNA and/or RNA helicase
VDSSQADDAKYVVLDCVVLGGAKADEVMGFLGFEPRRSNVALTRARAGRVVISSKNFCVGRHFDTVSLWPHLFKYEIAKKVIMDDVYLFSLDGLGGIQPQL